MDRRHIGEFPNRRWMDGNPENFDLGSSRVCFRTRVKLLEIDARCTRGGRAHLCGTPVNLSILVGTRPVQLALTK